MPLKTAEVIFNNTPSKFNKDLTDFLKRNMEAIIFRGQIKFKFKLASSKDLSTLRSKGITRLPAMRIDGRNHINVPTIIGEIRRRVKTSKTTASMKSNEEFLDEYMKNAIGDIKKDDDGRIIAEELDQEELEENGEKLLNELNRMTEHRYNELENNKKAGNKKQRPGTREQVRKPNRELDLDDDREDRRAPAIETERPGQRPTQRPYRPDNLEGDRMKAGDPLAALAATHRGQKTQDDEMMEALINRMGTDD